LWIRLDPFIREGEIFLLGTVLSHFFSLFASINSYHCLKIINTSCQDAWEWQVKMVHRALIYRQNRRYQRMCATAISMC
ncbi:type VI secretion system baseplate subunit TssF, partial [Escherichia coli]|uniref:type VI secretion system baseplate subunit TssF n=1 Tax=Escherichia coli TaxID=562 RepID=UPI00159BAD9B